MGALHKLLYQYGFTQFGVRLLSEHDPGSPEWFDFVEGLFDRKDLETRDLAVEQLKEDGFYAGTEDKDRLKNLALRFLKDGIGDEKRKAIQFFGVNRQHFSKDSAPDVFAAVYAACRASDKQVSTQAEEILTSWGFDRSSIKSDKELRAT